jgi:hypothetical protein
MRDLPSTSNAPAEKRVEQANQELRSAVAEPELPAIRIRKARGTAGQNLRLLKYGRHEVVLPS